MIALLAVGSRVASAGPIHSDVAFTPYKGGSVLRLQYRYEEADGGPVLHRNVSTYRAAYIYGLRSDLALIVNVPFKTARVDRFAPRLGRFEERHDGLADVTALVKYRFWQRDPAPLRTRRLAALAGVNVRSGDSDFSSDSYDPILGLVFSRREDRRVFDADLLYQFNTGGKEDRHDVLRYDLALSYRLLPAAFGEDDLYELQLVAELNGSYRTGGEHELFVSPGLQYTTQRWTWEASVQLPAVQESGRDAAETDYRIVVGVRYRW